MKILYIEDELSKNIPGMIRLFSAYLSEEQIKALNELETDISGYGAGQEEMKQLIEENRILEVEYSFSEALRKIIHQPEQYSFFIVDRNLSKYDYNLQDIQQIDPRYAEKLHTRYHEREGDYLFLKLALFSRIDVMTRFFFLTAYPASTELQSAKDVEQLIDLGKFKDDNFFEKGNDAELARLRQIMKTTKIEDSDYKTLIAQGESHYLEFKSTLRYCLKKQSPQKSIEYAIEHAVLKTIAAYLNSNGGTLLIGVDDSGQILGLDSDFSTFKKEHKTDEFLKYLDNLIANNLGNRFHRQLAIHFPVVDGVMICAIKVKEKASEGVWLKNRELNREQFYIRRSASTIELVPSEAMKYIKDHWG